MTQTNPAHTQPAYLFLILYILRRLGLRSGFFNLRFSTDTMLAFFLPHAWHVPCPPHLWLSTCNAKRGTRWCSWLRHCATSRTFAVSILDGVTGIFNWLNISGHTMVLGSIQPLTCHRRCVGQSTLPLSSAVFLEILGSSTSRTPTTLSRPVQGQLYLYLSL
jgi:hypothetical protein